MKTDQFVLICRENGIKPSTIYDLGCHEGDQSLELSQAFPEANVIGYEADPNIAVIALRKAVAEPRVHVFPLAVGEVDGPVRFYRASHGPHTEYGSLLVPNNEFVEPMPVESVVVPMIRLESAIDSDMVPPPDALWMDVQGAEWGALMGLGKYLAGVKIIWTEVAYRAYYEGQMLEPEFDQSMASLGFRKHCTQVGFPEWFGDTCYLNTNL